MPGTARTGPVHHPPPPCRRGPLRAHTRGSPADRLPRVERAPKPPRSGPSRPRRRARHGRDEDRPGPRRPRPRRGDGGRKGGGRGGGGGGGRGLVGASVLAKSDRPHGAFLSVPSFSVVPFGAPPLPLSLPPRVSSPGRGVEVHRRRRRPDTPVSRRRGPRRASPWLTDYEAVPGPGVDRAYLSAGRPGLDVPSRRRR